MSKATTWGELAAERDAGWETAATLYDSVKAFWAARDRYENTAYKSDALRELNDARNRLNAALDAAKPNIEKYRR